MVSNRKQFFNVDTAVHKYLIDLILTVWEEKLVLATPTASFESLNWKNNEEL